MGHYYEMSNLYIKAADSCDLVRAMLAVSPYRDDYPPTTHVRASLGTPQRAPHLSVLPTMPLLQASLWTHSSP